MVVWGTPAPVSHSSSPSQVKGSLQLGSAITLSSSPLSSIPSRLSSGSVTVRMTSTLGSRCSLVRPLSVMDSGCARRGGVLGGVVG